MGKVGSAGRKNTADLILCVKYFLDANRVEYSWHFGGWKLDRTGFSNESYDSDSQVLAAKLCSSDLQGGWAFPLGTL